MSIPHPGIFFPSPHPNFFLPSDEDLTVVDLPCTVHLQPPTSSFLSTGAPAAALLPQSAAGAGLRRDPPAAAAATWPSSPLPQPDPTGLLHRPVDGAAAAGLTAPPRARHHHRVGLPPPAFLLSPAMEIAGAQTQTRNPNPTRTLT
ncbi:hypothetical protein PVAP13_2KG375681 [Panicum virgatum]|uniref:Uncharacterized protein n=1 Tax=Panicum virgatum TaxID=38727 RepID=A0A8T0W5S7_PANVG|nr:hypothetical protein PVAP13_2KG375681 [Panicum virgatum]